MTASSLVWLSLLVAQADAERSTLDSVDSTRGGRHWIDQKTKPPKSAEDSLKCFQIEPGAKIELVASEPLVMDPVAIAFDHKGRMFVVEYGDYPTGPENPDDPPLSRVVLLENAIEFGMLPKRHVFADNLSYCHSLMPLMDGILVGAQTQILFLKDTDGDNKADVREVWFDGFTPAHPQMQIGNPRWGFDNRVYLNYGPGKVRMTRPGFKPTEAVQMPRKDFWFDPLTMEFGACSGLGQFGNTIDHRGYRFFTTNRNPIMVEMLPPEAVKRNPFAIIPKAYTDVGPSGGDTRVYPLVDMKSNYLSHAGTHTSACGVTAYLGDLFEGDYRDSVCVCEPIGHLVTRTIVTPDPNGVGLVANRAREKADFLASTDTWFRPASLATGPDGAVYLADMYRLWVEHPKFLPPDIAARINWREGEDRGRIWRIAPTGESDRPADRPVFRPAQTTKDLTNLLTDSNGWRRMLGQRLIVERHDVSAVPKLRNMTKSFYVDPQDRRRSFAPREETSTRALWTLDGLGVLTASELENVFNSILNSNSEKLQWNAAPLLTNFTVGDVNWTLSHDRLAHSKSARVRLRAALSLGEIHTPHATSILTKLAVQDGGDPWMALAILTSCAECSAEIASGVHDAWRESPETQLAGTHSGFVRQLAEVCGARGDRSELVTLLESFASDGDEVTWWQSAVLSGLSRGLPRHAPSNVPGNLPQLLSIQSEPWLRFAGAIKDVLNRSKSIALDPGRRLSDRVGAIELLSTAGQDGAFEVFAGLLDAGQPSALQQAAIGGMRRFDRPEVAVTVIERWNRLGPDARNEALALLMSRTAWTRLALQAMEENAIPAAVIDVDRRVRLLRHNDVAIRKLAEKLFGGAISANRKEVAKKYEAALSESSVKLASIEAGAKVFQKTCIKCHKHDGKGADVGPDISDVRNRSREALLFDILDPNRKVEPRFMDYSVVTTDGRTFNGLMISETAEAVVLRQAEGKQQVIPRNDIEILKASGRSLMPEGVEKDVTVQQMADLLEFLKSRDRPALQSVTSGAP